MTDFLPKRWIWFNHSIYTWLVKVNDLDKKVKSIREGKHSMVNKEMFELGSLIRNNLNAEGKMWLFCQNLMINITLPHF